MTETNILIYALIAALLLVFELGYFRMAEYFRIIDKPNERSSHKHPTIRGGGIIFVIAALMFSVWNGGAYPYLMVALLLSGSISFIDDIRNLPTSVRFLAHLCSGFLILYQCGLMSLSLILLAVIIVLIIGVINAYNFMDGINGITGFYSLAILIPLSFTEEDALMRELQYFTITGVIVFLLFNARRRARCFAGDVGSVSMAILVVYFLVSRIYREQNINYIAFLLLYGTDTIITIVQRLYLRENIFKAHRRHLFQLYCNEYGKSHIAISLGYGVLQFFINMVILRSGNNHYLLWVMIISSATLYTILKVMAYRGIADKG